MSYESTPGKAASRPPVVAPEPAGNWSVVIVAHPLCPCTAASLHALRSVVTERSLACRVVFAGERPAQPSESMKTAGLIPGAHVLWMDAKSAEEQYGTYTSGQTFLYDPAGRLVFSGGITPGRGVDQPRYAKELFAKIIDDKTRTRLAPVFGCSLREKQNDDRIRTSSRA